MKRILMASLFTITACASNDFYDFYNDNNVDPSFFIPRKNFENVKVITTVDIESRIKEYKDKGYIILGWAEFHGPWSSSMKAIEQAKRIKATVVIRYGNYTKSTNINYNIVVPQPHNTYHSGTVTGSYGYANFSGTSTSYTYNTYTHSYSVNLFNQGAVFMAKGVENYE